MSAATLCRRSSVNTLRDLTPEEIDMVSGGSDTITVTGSRYNYNFYSYYSFVDVLYEDYGGGGGGGEGNPPPAPVDELSEAQEEAIKNGMEGLKASLEAYVAKYGDFTLTLPGGKTYLASDLIRGADVLSKAFDVLEGAELTAAIVNGNADVGAVIGFVAGLAGTAAVGAAGAGPLAAFAAGLAISWGAEAGYNAIVGAIDRGVATGIANYNNAMQQANPGWDDLPSLVQEYIFLQQLFGIPSDPFNPPGGGGGGGGGGGDPHNPHYHIP